MFSFVLVLAAATPAADPKPIVASDPARLARLKSVVMPKIDKPLAYDTLAADAVSAALEVFPADNPWNLVVSDWPVHPDSAAIVASIGANKPLRYNTDMTYIFVPPDQPKVALTKVEYAGESDPGPFPIPDDVPIEGWPAAYQRDAKKKTYTLDMVQRNVDADGGDRHASVVDPVNRKLYEFFVLQKTAAGWQAGQASVFDLSSNRLRPDGWTSADAAGLPIFPAVVRYDELSRGEIEHALRFTAARTRRAYVHPATHFASRLTDPKLPRMGERFRLKPTVDTTKFTPPTRTLLKALQKYGMLLADNGLDWAVSCSADPRIPPLHAELRRLTGADFEVVVPPTGYVPAK